MSDIVCQKKFQVMGGDFQFSCFPQTLYSKDDVYLLFDEAYQEVKRIEEKFTDFKPGYFNRINDNSGFRPVTVDDETIMLIKKSQKISELSHGVFDISFASIGHLWRQSKNRGKVLDDELVRERLRHINYRLIKINEDEKTIFLPHRDMKIGLGGIGKGYAVDQVYKLFIGRGLTNFYINGSGDIRVHSRVDAPRKWRIGIRNPLSDDASKSVGVVQLGNGAIASSGGYIHNVKGDKFNHHIISPKTGRSNSEVIASTVLANDAVTADTTATILMNLGKISAVEFMNDNGLMGLVFCSEGKSYLSASALDNFRL